MAGLPEPGSTWAAHVRAALPQASLVMVGDRWSFVRRLLDFVPYILVLGDVSPVQAAEVLRIVRTIYLPVPVLLCGATGEIDTTFPTWQLDDQAEAAVWQQALEAAIGQVQPLRKELTRMRVQREIRENLSALDRILASLQAEGDNLGSPSASMVREIQQSIAQLEELERALRK